MVKKLLQLALGLVIAAGVSTLALADANTAPIDASYNNRIVDDSIFANTSAMSSAIDVQNFLNAKVPTCSTNHTPPAPTQSNPNPPQPPYICLKDYTDPTTNKKASQLIYDEAQTFGLNPEVILVTLEKEESLVTDTWPFPAQYQTAMGYGCPDGGNCAADYYGLYNQVHLGAKLLRVGLDRNCGNTSSYPGWSFPSQYRQGNTTTIDDRATYMATCSTGALYGYTPHRPDSAWIADGFTCGQQHNQGCYYYGNYNFITLFGAWFGPTTTAHLSRTVNSPALYLVNLGVKYPVLSQDIMNTFGVFGGTNFVDQNYLDGLSTGSTLSRLGRDPNSGAVYLLDSGQKIQFGDCTMVSAYGFNCADAVNLPTSILNGFNTSIYQVSNVVKGSPSALYKAEAGRKRLIPDQATYTASGLNSSVVTILSDAMVGYLADGAPILRDQVVVVNNDNGQAYLYIAGADRLVPNLELFVNWNFSALPTYRFGGGLVGLIAGGANITAYAQDSGGNQYLMDHGAKQPLASNASQYPFSNAGLPDNLINAVPTGTNPGLVVKKASAPDVFLIDSGKKRPFPSANDLVRSGYAFNNVVTLDGTNLDPIPTGVAKFGSLSLIKAASGPSVMMVDGSASYYVPSPQIAAAVGLALSNVATVDQTTINAYPNSGTLGRLITNGTTNYLADGGSKFSVDGTTSAAYSFGSYLTLSNLAINNIPSTVALTRFIKGSGSTIYFVANGQKQPFASYQAYANAGGNSGNTLTLSDDFMQTLPTGPTQF